MNVKKIMALICLHSVVVQAAVLDVRTKSSVPLLYNMMEMQKEGRVYYASVKPIGGRSFDGGSMAEAVTINGKQTFSLEEYASAGATKVNGDINPLSIGLTDHSSGYSHAGDYASQVSLSPQVKMFGALLHFYTRCHKYFVDVRSALLWSRTHIKITETNGGTGQHLAIKTFKDAMTNEKWNYGKMGEEQKAFGLDNIQIKIGAFKHFFEESGNDHSLAGYLLVEIPTGKGTKAEWAFEPRVGKNHFGLGLGAEEYYTNDKTRAMVGLNWRYLFGAKETRSFDVTKNGPWSRYIRVVTIPAPTTIAKSSPGINVLTRKATVTLGSQLNAYFRWGKKWDNGVEFEVAYNYMYQQAERISDVADAASKFGIYFTQNSSGNTSSKAKMNSFTVTQDASQIETVTSDLDLASAAVGALASSLLSVRCEKGKDRMRYGVGGSAEVAHSKSAYASWNIWANLGLLF